MKEFVNRISDWIFDFDHPWRGSVFIGMILTLVIIFAFFILQNWSVVMNFINAIPIQAKMIFVIFIYITVLCRIELY